MPRCNEASSKSTPATEISSPPIRASKAGRWRALALLLVHALIALHIAHWAQTGKTLSPLEPSEAMQFSKQALLNAGAVFFGLTILSTLVLGRWFCGWACHVVALQDACRWILLKLRIRPRAVNLGVLGVVPWLAFVYMFLAPMVQRLILGDSLAARGTHYMTESFWATFPSWPVALATFLCCGFAIVYFLGSKGFCNYGCPYGAIYGVVDQLAPVRIRVTDACEGCGHCTAVCSSNVKVHQEVRDYGMVVDAGCMKCLDCVSVCPNDALYVGFGVPAMFAKERAKGGAAALTTSRKTAQTLSTEAASSRATGAGAISHALLLLVFTFATLAVFMSFDAPLDLRLLAWLGVGCFVVAWIFRGKARRVQDYSLGEELMLAVSFLAAMLAFRGFHDAVPFLFALGLSACLAYAFVQLVRLAYAPNVGIQDQRLRLKGRVTRRGVMFASLMVPVLAVWTLAGISRYRAGERADLAQILFRTGVQHYEQGNVNEAINSLHGAVALAPDSAELRRSLGGMLCDAGRIPEGIEQFEIVLRQTPEDMTTLVLSALAYREVGNLASARRNLETAVRIAPKRADAHLILSELCAQLGDQACAEQHRARAMELDPNAAR